MINKIKTPQESEVTMTEIVFPNDTNPMGIMHGGRIVQLMDTACAICAQTHAERIAVTASIDKVSFKQPAKLGDILTISAKVTRAFKTSMEIHTVVWSKRLPEMKLILNNDAYFTFVTLDEKAKPISTYRINPITPEEKKQYRAALKRKKERTTGNI